MCTRYALGGRCRETMLCSHTHQNGSMLQEDMAEAGQVAGAAAGQAEATKSFMSEAFG